MLDAARISQDVALVRVQLQGVVGLHLHQSAQELSAVLEVDPRFGQTHDKIRGEEILNARMSFLALRRCVLWGSDSAVITEESSKMSFYLFGLKNRFIFTLLST